MLDFEGSSNEAILRWVFLLGLCNRLFFEKSSSASGLVVKSNVAIVGPRVRFPAGASELV